MKTWLVLPVLAFSLNCMYLLREPRDLAASQAVQPPAVPVALVGFYPYIAKDVTPQGDTGKRVFQAEVLYNGRLQQLLGIGRPASELVADGVDLTVPAAKVQEFKDTYLKAVGPSGAKELQTLFKDEDGKSRLRNIKAQYFVVGIHQPSLEETVTPTISFITMITCALTLGIVPQYAQFVGTSRFLVYDNKLNLRKTVEYKSEYVRLFSIVLIPLRNDRVDGLPDVKQSPNPLVWDADVLDFRVALNRFLMEEAGGKGGKASPAGDQPPKAADPAPASGPKS